MINSIILHMYIHAYVRLNVSMYNNNYEVVDCTICMYELWCKLYIVI